MRNRIAIVVCIFFLIVIAFQFGCRTSGDYSSTGASSTPAQGVTITGNIVVNEIETGNLADIRMAVASGSIVSFSSFIANLIDGSGNVIKSVAVVDRSFVFTDVTPANNLRIEVVNSDPANRKIRFLHFLDTLTSNVNIEISIESTVIGLIIEKATAILSVEMVKKYPEQIESVETELKKYLSLEITSGTKIEQIPAVAEAVEKAVAVISSTFTTPIASSTINAPINIAVTTGDRQNSIAWNPVDGATSYNLYWSMTYGVTKSSGAKISGIISPYVHSTLTNGTTYYYVVTAVNSAGESVESSQAFGTPHLPGQQPDIIVKGNNASISNGDMTPDPVDGTDFGTASIGAFVIRTFYIENTGSAALTVSSVTISGTNSDEFTVSTPPSPSITGGTSSSFQVKFTPSGVGTRVVTVNIINDVVQKSPYTFLIQGVGKIEPLTISDVRGIQTTLRGATISWMTNRESTSLVEYGETENYGFPTATDTAKVKSHIGTLAGLSGPKIYCFRVSSVDAYGLLAVATGSFTFIPWDPDIKVTGNGIPISNGSTSPDSQNGTDFGEASYLPTSSSVTKTFSIGNVGSGTLIFSGIVVSGGNSSDFEVVSKPSSIPKNSTGTIEVKFTPTAAGTRTASIIITSNDPDESTFQFAVKGVGKTEPLTISDVRGTQTTFRGATISWTTNRESTSLVEYGDTENYGSITATDAVKVKNHVVTLAGLISLTGPKIYYFRVSSVDAYGLPAVATGSFTFIPWYPDIKVTGNGIPISNGSTSPDSQNGTDFGEAFYLPTSSSVTKTFSIGNVGSGTLILGAVASGANSSDFEVVSQPSSIPKNSTGTVDVKFTPTAAGTRTASIIITSNDPDEGTFQFAVKGVGIEPDTTPPVISGFTAGSITHNSAVITWTTDEDSTSQVEYGTTTSYGSSSTLDSTKTKSHSVTLSGLTVATAYHYRVKSTDTANNPSISSDQTFSTSPAPGPEVNVKGNNTNIACGSTAPSSSNHTDFGNAEVASITVTRTFTIENTGNATLNLLGNPIVVISGTNASEFAVVTQPSSTVSAGGNVTFDMKFTPTASDTRTATVSIANNDSDENPYTFAIQGAGTKSGSNTVNFTSIISGATRLLKIRILNIGSLTSDSLNVTLKDKTNTDRPFVYSASLSSASGSGGYVLAFNEFNVFDLADFTSVTFSKTLPSGATVEIWSGTPDTSTKLGKATIQ